MNSNFLSSSKSKKFEKCSEAEACKLKAAGKTELYKIDFTYDSWTKEYGLYCGTNGKMDLTEKRELGKTIYFFINVIGCFVILYSIDKIGRKNTAVLTAVVVMSSMSVASLIRGWYVGMISTGIANGCEGCLLNLMNVIMCESSCKISLTFNI